MRTNYHSNSRRSRQRRRLAGLLVGVALGLGACASQPPAEVEEVGAGVTPGPDLRSLIRRWNDPLVQAVEPFQIFDNLYYVGIEWVAAYVLQTPAGLVLIDSLYGKWVERMLDNMRRLGLDPADIRYVIVTHGHFDHAGGAAEISRRFGATVVMTESDWALARQPAAIPDFAFDVPTAGQIARDGDIIELGGTLIELFETPGHTEGVLTLRYPVYDGRREYRAMTLGGVGLNFAGVARTQSYLDSYDRLLNTLSVPVSASLPNHAAMGEVFQRAERLRTRSASDPHPFVDGEGFRNALRGFIAAAEDKLEAEKNGTAADPLEALTSAISN
ncbi:MAG: MBL fold metallo-hydrolase [Pseudomonadota bacterium]